MNITLKFEGTLEEIAPFLPGSADRDDGISGDKPAGSG